MSQFITVIAQEQIAEIQLQCHLGMERSNPPKVWKYFTRDDDHDSERASCIDCIKKYRVKVLQLAVFFVT